MYYLRYFESDDQEEKYSLSEVDQLTEYTDMTEVCIDQALSLPQSLTHSPQPEPTEHNLEGQHLLSSATDPADSASTVPSQNQPEGAVNNSAATNLSKEAEHVSESMRRFLVLFKNESEKANEFYLKKLNQFEKRLKNICKNVHKKGIEQIVYKPNIQLNLC